MAVPDRITEAQGSLQHEGRADESPNIMHLVSQQGEPSDPEVILKDPDTHERSHLILAAQTGDYETAQKLLAAGADPDESNFGGCTPLIEAAFHGCVRTIRSLLEGKAKLEHRDSLGRSALLHACLVGRSLSVRTLLEAGADPNCLCATGDTPLSAAIFAGSGELVTLLIKYGATRSRRGRDTPVIDSVLAGEAGPLSALITANIDLERPGELGFTPLHLAIATDQTVLAQVLLKAGALCDPAAANGIIKGETPLMRACIDNRPTLVNLLLEHGATVDRRDARGRTALSIAARYAKESVIRNLLKAGADPLLADEAELAPFDHATKSGRDEDVLDTLAQASGRIRTRAPNYLHLDLLTEAAGRNDLVLILELLSLGVDVNLCDQRGETAMTAACKGNRCEVLHTLLAAGASPSLPNSEGWTPLLIACKVGSQDLASILLRSGASPAERTPDRHTAICIAADHGHSDLVEVLVGQERIEQQVVEDSTSLRFCPTQPSRIVPGGHP